MVKRVETVKAGLRIICILIALVSMTACGGNDSSLTSMPGNEIRNATPGPIASEMDGSANITRGAFATIQDGWIYCVFSSNSIKRNGIYKMKPDGTNRVKLCSGDISGICVSGNWIVYNDWAGGVYKIKTDGTSKKKIWTAEDVNEVNIVENQVYFSGIQSDETQGGDVWNLCKMNVLDNKMQVLQYFISEKPNMHIVNGWIYYYWDEPYLKVGKRRNVYKMRTDGTERQLALEDKTYDFTVAGDWIYYLVATNEAHNTYSLNKIRTDGTGRQMLAENMNLGVNGGRLNVVGDWVYYITGNKAKYYAKYYEKNIYKIRTDGTQNQMIAKDIILNNSDFVVTGDWIFYRTYNDRLYRIKTDGTNKEIIESGKDVKE